MKTYICNITAKDIIVYSFIVILLLSTSFFSYSGFVETHVVLKCYGFILASILLIAIILFSPSKISVDKTFIATSIFLGYILFRMLIQKPLTTTTILVICFYLLYLSLKAFPKDKLQYFEILVLGTCIAQALYGIGQFVGIFTSSINFKVTGSFDNPAGFASCLAVGFPFCLTLLEKSKSWKVIGFICLSIISIAITLSGSRAGIIAITIISIIYIIHRYKIHLKVIYIIPMLIFIISLIYVKQDSAIGRVAIWNNSIEMIKDKPLLGYGKGGFRANYMLYQAEYFDKNPNSSYAKLADNVSFSFNEYLLLTIEYGLIGLLLLCGVFVTVSLSKHTSLAPLLCLLSVGVISCFSYPLRYPFTLVLIAYSLASISKHSLNSQWSISIVMRILIIVIVGFISVKSIKNIAFEYKWGKNAKEMILVNSEDTLKNYQKLYNQWNGNSFFLYNYGAILNQREHFSTSNVVMKICTHYLNDYYVQMIIGDNYFNMNELDSAKYHYKLAHNMVPNRFMPLYCLMELYMKEKNHEKALEIANIIISKEIKVPSSNITMIVEKAHMIIAEIKYE